MLKFRAPRYSVNGCSRRARPRIFASRSRASRSHLSTESRRAADLRPRLRERRSAASITSRARANSGFLFRAVPHGVTNPRRSGMRPRRAKRSNYSCISPARFGRRPETRSASDWPACPCRRRCLAATRIQNATPPSRDFDLHAAIIADGQTNRRNSDHHPVRERRRGKDRVGEFHAGKDARLRGERRRRDVDRRVGVGHQPMAAASKPRSSARPSTPEPPALASRRGHATARRAQSRSRRWPKIARRRAPSRSRSPSA